QGFDVHATERGGDVTYHGPGQLVGYPILDLGALDEDVVRYVRGLEAALIGALERFGIPGARLRGYPGVWVGDAKVAAIGVAVKRRVTMHGFALNVAPDLDHFGVINPCGLGKPVTSMARLLGRPVSLAEVHGGEYPGIEAAIQTARALDPAGIRGGVIIVHVVDVPAFHGRNIYICPLDGKNPNRVFPGNPAGSASERLAHTVFTEVISQ